MPTALWATNSGVIGTTRTSPVWMRLSRGVSPVERCWPMHPPSITMATVGTAKARSRLFTLASSLLERHRQSFDYLVRVDGPIRRHREWKPKGHARVFLECAAAAPERGAAGQPLLSPAQPVGLGFRDGNRHHVHSGVLEQETGARHVQ